MIDDSAGLLFWLSPWEFSPTITLFFALVTLLYIRGLQATAGCGEGVSLVRVATFFVGMILCYGVMHTQYDYYAQYMFFMHRIQHLVLHHLGPFLIALSLPVGILKRGIPELAKRPIAQAAQFPPLRFSYRVLQFPPLAAFLFVGLIFFWLTPDIHFAAMLNRTLYHVMNWSMFLDGLLFWWLIFNPAVSHGLITLSYGWRIVILLVIMVPQIILGAYITLSESILFDVYEVCGRAWPLDPMTDQIVGGIVTWIPPAMMSAVGVLIMLAYMRKYGGQSDSEKDRGVRAGKEKVMKGHIDKGDVNNKNQEVSGHHLGPEPLLP